MQYITIQYTSEYSLGALHLQKIRNLEVPRLHKTVETTT